MTEAERELALLLVEVLNLDSLDLDALDPAAPLFGNPGSGWNLDSIDALEIALALQQKYQITLRSDDDASRQAFASLRTLSAYVQQHLPRAATPLS